MSPEVRRAGLHQTGSADDSGPSKDHHLAPTSYADGLDMAVANASADWWFTGAMVALQQLAITARGFTVDHLVDLVGEPPDPHYLGSVFSAAQKMSMVEAVGCKVGRGGRLVRVWWGVPR